MKYTVLETEKILFLAYAMFQKFSYCKIFEI